MAVTSGGDRSCLGEETAHVPISCAGKISGSDFSLFVRVVNPKTNLVNPLTTIRFVFGSCKTNSGNHESISVFRSVLEVENRIVERYTNFHYSFVSRIQERI